MFPRIGTQVKLEEQRADVLVVSGAELLLIYDIVGRSSPRPPWSVTPLRSTTSGYPGLDAARPSSAIRQRQPIPWPAWSIAPVAPRERPPS